MGAERETGRRKKKKKNKKSRTGRRRVKFSRYGCRARGGGHGSTAAKCVGVLLAVGRMCVSRDAQRRQCRKSAYYFVFLLMERKVDF